MTATMPSAEKVRRLVNAHLIAGVTADAVLRRADKRRDRKTALVRWVAFKRLREEGYSYKGIARRFGMDHTTVMYALQEIAKGRSPYSCTNRGDKNGQAKLNAEAVREVRTSALIGMSHRQIAAQFGVDRKTISKVISRKTWGHVI